MSSGLSPDARALVRVVEALTMEVRRLADALETPVIEHVDAVVDDATTCGASAVTTFGSLGPCTLRPGHQGPVHKAGRQTFWREEQAPAADGVKRSLPFPYPSELAEDERVAREYRADDEDQTLRWARRESLLVLLTRLQRGRTLTEDEARTLREHVEHEMREADTARSVAAGNKRHVQVMYAELEEAQAVIERVRTLVEGPAHPTSAGISGEAIGRHVLAREVLAALDGTEQPPTKRPDENARLIAGYQAAILRVLALRQPIAEALEQADYRQDMRRGDLADAIMPVIRAALEGPEQPTTQPPTTCTATIPDSLNSPTLHRCIGPAGHYDESDEPVHTGPDRSPGGWHTDGEGHVWSDRAANARPHTEQPTTEEG